VTFLCSLCFSGDCKWVVSASADGTVRTWDIVSAQCIDAFRCAKAAVALAFSPKNDLLATAHVDDVGIFVWSNRAYYQQMFLRPFDDAQLVQSSLPAAVMEDEERDHHFFAAPVADEGPEDAVAAFEEGGVWQFLRDMTKAESVPLVKLSGEPESKVARLLTLFCWCR
jgi:hypothetical protein